MAVNLQKGQKISLEKEAGSQLSEVIMGLGWDAIKKKGFLGFGGGEQEIDLDASCILFNEAKDPVDVVWFKQLKSKDGSIVHTGDNRTGAGDGDDEQIKINLSSVPKEIQAIVFTVNSFTGQDFSQVENAFCRIVNGRDGKEIARYNLSGQGRHSAQIMTKIYRHDNEWKMHAIGVNGVGATFDKLIPQIISHL